MHTRASAYTVSTTLHGVSVRSSEGYSTSQYCCCFFFWCSCCRSSCRCCFAALAVVVALPAVDASVILLLALLLLWLLLLLLNLLLLAAPPFFRNIRTCGSINRHHNWTSSIPLCAYTLLVAFSMFKCLYVCLRGTAIPNKHFIWLSFGSTSMKSPEQGTNNRVFLRL